MALQFSYTLKHCAFCIVPKAERIISEGGRDLALRGKHKHLVLFLAQRMQSLHLSLVNLVKDGLLQGGQLIEALGMFLALFAAWRCLQCPRQHEIEVVDVLLEL